MSAIKFYKVRIYVGPVHVAHYAAQARAGGLTDVLEGTEHLYGVIAAQAGDSKGDELCLQQRVADLVYGCVMAGGWRDVEIMGRY